MATGLLAAVMLALAPPALSGEPARESPSPAAEVERLEGRYRFSGGAAEHHALEAAIDDVVDDMNIFVRGAARRRLAKAATIPGEVALSLRGDELAVKLPDGTYAAPLDGSPVQVTSPSGDPVRLQHRVVGDAKIVQRFASEDGTQVNTCERLGDGRLRIQVAIHSPKLPKELRYAMTFSPTGA